MQISKSHIGKIVDYLRSPDPYNQITGYRIVENNVHYIAHLGDVSSTEYMLYNLRDHKEPFSLDLETFDIGDEVEFEVFGDVVDVKHAIRVRKHT